jgi:FkbM family methyltransferase
MNIAAIKPGTVIFDNPPLRLKSCRHGLMLFHRNDKYVGRSLDAYGEYSEVEAELFRHILRPGMVALDVGANIGIFSIVLARAVFPGGNVIAIEAQRVLHQVLCANLALNGIRNVRALHAGAGRERATARAPHIDFSGSSNFGGVALTTSGAGEPVEIIPIDDVPIEACHFIKIDVEGMESDVLAGAAATISRHRPILYVENAFSDKSPALIAQLRDLGYRLYRHVPPLFNPANVFGHPRDIFDGIASYNMLCMARESTNQPTGAREITGPADWPLEQLASAKPPP